MTQGRKRPRPYVLSAMRKAGRATARPRQRVLSSPLQKTLGRLVDAANEAVGINPGAITCQQDQSDNRFKVAVYRMVRELLEGGILSRIEMIVGTQNDGRKTISFKANPYNWALLALKNSGDCKKVLSLNAVNVIGWQLEYARRHEIEPELLIGFLYQTAASSATKQKIIKSDINYREPWFNEFEQRVLHDKPHRLKVEHDD